MFLEQGQCETSPQLLHDESLNSPFTYTCKRKGLKGNGNYISFTKDKNTLEIDYVWTKYCQPRPKDCSCSKLFDAVLGNKQFHDVSRLELAIETKKDDYVAACRCYLGASSRAGFDTVEMRFSVPTKCNGKRSISTSTYVDICEKDLAPNYCIGVWHITKS